jgi:hypothetical protein
MAGRSKITVTKSNGNLGRRTPNADMVSALVMNGVATASYALGDIVEFRSAADAEALGLDAAYDAANNVLVHHHIERFFLRNASGILHVMLVDQAVTLTEMVDKDEDYLAKLLRDKAGAVVQWAVALNPVIGYVPTLVTGLDEDVVDAIPKAQELINAEFEKFRYSDGIIEGRSFNGTTAAALDLRTLEAENVSVVIASDPAIADDHAIKNGYAAVGDVLGLVSFAAVSQNIGEQSADFNLTNAAQNVFETAGLSSNKPLADYTDTDLDTLHDKGYIFADVNAGEVGFWLNDSSTCTGLDSDYAYLENNRTINKAIKQARAALNPRIKARIYVDPDTGKISATDAKSFESDVVAKLRPMKADGDISGGIDCYVDPEQNILATSEIKVEVTFVPVAIGRQIKLTIGFKNPLKS